MALTDPHHIMRRMFRHSVFIFVPEYFWILKRAIMLTANDVARIYDTILSIPGMSETVKVDMKISRRNVLLLHSVFRRGLSPKEDDKSPGLLDSIPKETLQELQVIADDLLTKAGLIELNEKLSALSTK